RRDERRRVAEVLGQLPPGGGWVQAHRPPAVQPQRLEDEVAHLGGAGAHQAQEPGRQRKELEEAERGHAQREGGRQRDPERVALRGGGGGGEDQRAPRQRAGRPERPRRRAAQEQGGDEQERAERGLGGLRRERGPSAHWLR